jgi:hypothetical protein
VERRDSVAREDAAYLLNRGATSLGPSGHYSVGSRRVSYGIDTLHYIKQAKQVCFFLSRGELHLGTWAREIEDAWKHAKQAYCIHRSGEGGSDEEMVRSLEPATEKAYAW